MLKAVDAFAVSANGKQLLAKAGGAWMLVTSLGKDEKRLDLDRVRVRVEPELEWRQILREVWRIQRDYFYDAKMHGVDWTAMWERWSPMLAHVHHRADLNLVIGELIGELAAGHQYVNGGDLPAGPTAPGTGLLGADFAVEGGRFRLARIYRGQNWNPGLRAPLTEPGVDAKVGDYLVAVDGVDVKADRELFAAFEATADRQVELTWSDAPEGGKLRRTTVVPVGGDGELRRRAWIESNRATVDRLSAGRLAYVYMPDTGGGGLAAFDRDFYSQVDKQGLVLDERYNGGGKVADYVIGVLGRKVLCHWRTRDGWLARTPFGTLEGPKVMLINERAGSGGDALPWMFRKTGLGPLVGVRTWGGLVGISGYPELMDGGGVTAAAFGIVDTDGRWVVENEGVAPDVEVFETPKDLLAGRDPQLETGVRLVLEALAKNPPRKPPEVGAPDPPVDPRPGLPDPWRGDLSQGTMPEPPQGERMNWTEMLTCEVEGVYHATEGLLKLVKKDTLGWKPSTGSNWMTVGQLLAHIPTACGFCMNGFLTGEWGMPEPKPGEAPKPDDMLPPAEKMPSAKTVAVGREGARGRQGAGAPVHPEGRREGPRLEEGRRAVGPHAVHPRAASSST